MRTWSIKEAYQAVERAISMSPKQSYKDLRERLAAKEAESSTSGLSSACRDTFASVGGMHALKEQVRRIISVIYNQRDKAKQYGSFATGFCFMALLAAEKVSLPVPWPEVFS
jgi:hypothetical protein